MAINKVTSFIEQTVYYLDELNGELTSVGYIATYHTNVSLWTGDSTSFAIFCEKYNQMAQ